MKIILLSIILIISTFFSLAQVPLAEREALVALYNSTNGINWYVDTNWNTDEPISTWNNVTVENISGQDHVTEIKLRFNNLLGSIPNELVNLTHLIKLELSANSLYGNIPDFSVISSLDNFNIQYNNFQFADFENEFYYYNDNISGFYYYPMKKIEDDIIYNLDFGNTYTMTMPSINGVDVTYQWYKNNEPIVDETDLVLIINDAQFSDAANYTCLASSPVITNLKIERNTIHIYTDILESDKNALIAFMNSMGGPNWDISSPVYSWYGIKVEGSRVVSIDLGYKNLEGVLPSDLGNLTALKRLDLLNNNISGNIPIEISNCENLTLLSLEDNQLTGNIPIEFVNLTAMESFWVNGNLLSGELPDIFFNWSNLKYFSIGMYDGSTNYGLTGKIDLSNNSLLSLCWVAHTNISSLLINNGNNYNITDYKFRATNCPNLLCTVVDDIVYSNENWLHVDSEITFVETQLECDILNIIDNEDLSLSTNIFPNPTFDIIHINSELDFISIIIYNATGNIIDTLEFSKTINISNLPSGLYFFKLSTANGVNKNYTIIKK